MLNKGLKKIISLFYNNKTDSFYLREIGRKTKLNENSVYRFLNQLEKKKILISKREGTIKKYRINKNKTTYSLFTLIDTEKFENLPELRKESLKIYQKKLKERPVFIILFGSTAKETYRKDSDIDLLLITNNKIQTKQAEKEAEAITNITISTFQMNYDEFIKEIKLKKDRVIQSAIETGYPITNHIDFYEAIYNK